MAGASEESVFAEALEIENLQERAAFLDRACAGNLALRKNVQSLLSAYGAGQFLEPPAPAPAATTDEPIRERPGAVIGPYKLLERIGEGGFGIVFMAEQQHPVRRKVALKLLKPGMDTRQVVARFEAERQALALMDHPHIAKVFDGGETPTGRPFFVMDLVKGVPITHYCDQNQLTARKRLELFIQVCHAVQHAHQKGIIHRDVKPSNVLVSRHDGTPVAKVIDFGIAKALGQQLTDKTLFTNFAQLIGTPLYMSPEQAGMSDLDVDTRSDIYSLGVLLYELLTGTTPFDQERLQGVGFDELRRIIREEDPPRPSTRISTLGQAASTVSTNRQSDPKQLSRLFRGELDWIVMKALEKDRGRRYETANGFALDVQRYLADEPVLAGPPSTWYRFRKFARRNRIALTTVGVVALALLLGAGISLWQAVQATRAREAEVRQRNHAQENLRLSLEALDEMYTQLAVKRLAQRPDLKDLQREYLQRALAFYQRFAKENSDDPTVRFETAKAFHRVGDIQGELGHAQEAAEALNQARAIYEDLMPGPDADADLKVRRQLALCLNKLGDILTDMGQFAEAEAVLDQGWNLLNELAGQYPDDVRYQELRQFNRRGAARLRNASGHRQEAVALYKQLVAELTALVQANPANPRFQHLLASSHVDLGALLMDCGPQFWQQARSSYESALPIIEGLIKRSPDNPGYRSELALARYDLGSLFHRMGDFPRSTTMLRAALALYQELVDRFPTATDYRRELARTHLGLGLVFIATNRLVEAEQPFAKAVDLYAPLAQRFPNVVDYKAGLAKSKLNLAKVLAGTKRQTKAVELWSHALSLYDELMGRFPANDEYVAGAAECRYRLGEASAASGEKAKAEQSWRQSLGLYEKLARHSPEQDGYQDMLAHCHYSLARQLDKAGQEQDAELEYRRAAGYLHKLIARQPQAAEYRSVCAGCHNNLGVILKNRGKRKDARDEYGQALQVDPDNALVAGILVWLLCISPSPSAEDTGRALELARKLVARVPENGQNQRLFGMACYRAGDWKAAITAFQKTVKLHEGAEAVDAFFTAMALTKLGKHKEARHCHDTGIDWLKYHKTELVREGILAEELRRLQLEAAQVLGIQK